MCVLLHPVNDLFGASRSCVYTIGRTSEALPSGSRLLCSLENNPVNPPKLSLNVQVQETV